MTDFREILKELKEMGYIVVIEQNILIVKKKDTGVTVKEIHPRTLSERESMLSNYLEGLKKE